LQLLPQPVAADFHAAHRNIHQLGNFFRAEVHARVGAEALVFLRQARVERLQGVEEIAVHLVEMQRKLFPFFIESRVAFQDADQALELHHALCADGGRLPDEAEQEEEQDAAR